MKARPWSCAAVVLSLAALGCGGVDEEDPEAVARALTDAIYRCDQADIDLIRELTLGSEAEELEDLDAAKDNCGGASSEIIGLDHDSGQPEEPPSLEVAPVTNDPSQQILRVRQVGENYGSSNEGYIVLVSDDDRWLWSPDTDLDESDLRGLGGSL